MKIEVLVEYDPRSLEKSVNEFIANKHVINIQFKVNNYPDYFAFVTYKDSNNRELTLRLKGRRLVRQDQELLER